MDLMLLFCFGFFVKFGVVSMLLTDEQRLMNNILYNYDVASRPTYNASSVVQVKFQITLIQIYQLDEVNQVLTTNVWLEQEWHDERLHWNPSEYNRLSTLRIPCEKLWLPDIVLYNSADDFTSGYMQSKAMVESNGTIFWPPPAKFRSTCKIDITYFPFDDQSCSMKFGSWTYGGTQVDIIKRQTEVDTTNYVHSGEWQLIAVKGVRNVVTYPCCNETYPDITFTIVMRRRTLYYLFNIILPCLWLTVLSLLSFWLPPDSGEKITLGITVLLAFSVFMLLIAENMPATSEFVPLIGIYLTVTMATTSLSIVLTVIVLHIHHTGPNHKPINQKIRHIFFDIVAPLLRMTTVRRYNLRHSSHHNNNNIEPWSMTFGNVYALKEKVLENNRNHQEYNRSGSVCSEKLLGPRDCFTSETDSSDNRNSDFPNNISFPSTPLTNPCMGRNDLHEPVFNCHSTLQQYNEIVRQLLKLITRQHEEEQDQERTNEWKVLAYILDRCLFWIFASAAVLSTTIILLIMPLFKMAVPDPR